MLIAYKRISSLGTSHVPSQYMDEWHETLDIDQDRLEPIVSTGTVNNQRGKLLIKMAHILSLIQHKEVVKKSSNMRNNIVEAIYFLTHIQHRKPSRRETIHLLVGVMYRVHIEHRQWQFECKYTNFRVLCIDKKYVVGQYTNIICGLIHQRYSVSEAS